MPKSKVNAHCEEDYNEQYWLISIINTGDKSGGHAALVVEGMESNPPNFFLKNFIGQYDIAANAEEQQSNSLNTKGYITKIKCFEDEQNKRDYEQAHYPARTYKVPRDKARAMIAAIKRDAEYTRLAMENMDKEKHGDVNYHRDATTGEIIRPFSFQYLGSTHPLVKFFGNADDGNNCAGWCLAKLTEEAGIEDADFLPKPKKVAGQCTIL